MKKYKNYYRLDPLDQIDGILSGIKYNKTSGKVIRASAFLNIWLLKQNGTKDPNGELIDAVAMEWEKVFIEEIIVKEKNMGNQEDLTINGFTDRRYAKYLKIQIKEENILRSWVYRKCYTSQYYIFHLYCFIGNSSQKNNINQLQKLLSETYTNMFLKIKNFTFCD